MEYLATEDLSEYQIFIIKKRIKYKTYDQICQRFQSKFGIILYENKLTTSLKRAAIGFGWTPGMTGGHDPYLCTQDMKELRESVQDAIMLGKPMECNEVLDEAFKIKVNRIYMAIQFFTAIECFRLINSFDEEWIQPPTRSWINLILEDIDAHIINRRLIDPKRLDSCSYAVVEKYFNDFGEFIRSFHHALIFGADETMIESLPRKKVVVPNNVQTVLHDDFPDISHITSMMCHTFSGVSLPPLKF